MDTESAQAPFLPAIAEALENELAIEWQVQPGKDDSDPWISAQPGKKELPEQGWKLHVSATAESSEDVLRRCLAVLAADPAAFKVAGSQAAVEYLNEGLAGLSQIGKFITVYPHDDAQAVRLARELDSATRGLAGPQVPSDRPLRPGSLVHYRYGGFTERIAYTSVGEAVPTIRAGGGEWVRDVRGPYARPEGIEDPFEEAGVAESEPTRALAGRYSPVAVLHRSPRGSTHLAIDLEEVRTVVLKQASRGARARPGVGDARDQLRWEAEVLRRVGPNPRFPRALDLVERGDDVFLVLERFEGEPLGHRVTRLAASGRITEREQITGWGRELAAAVAGIHADGLVFRDLSPMNVIIGPDDGLRLIDFELAAAIGSTSSGEAVGTLGYASPQQYAGEAPSVLDDVYSLGALLFLIATGTDPVFVEDKETFLERPVSLLNPDAGDDLAAVIDRCRDPDPAQRFPGVGEVAEALAALPGQAPSAASAVDSGSPDRGRYAELASEIGSQLATWIDRGSYGEGHGSLEGLEERMELASAILALMALEPARISGGLESVAAGVSRLTPLEPTGAAGLYLGEGGIAVTLARAARLLGDAEIAAAAADRTEHLTSLSPRGNDLFSGAAGALRAQLLLWRESGEGGPVPPTAIATGDALLNSAEEVGQDGLRWRSPPDPGESTGAIHIGYAHGTAGIGDVLLDLAEASGERRFADTAAAAGRWVIAQALPALGDGEGLAWPEQEGEMATPPLWCRGSTGIGRFLLHLSEAGAQDGAHAQAERAARTAARGGRFLGPTSCHGLAGSIEYLLDVGAVTGTSSYVREADTLAAILSAFRDTDGVWRSDSGEPLAFDLLTGIAGVGVSLSRLSDPGRRWALLDPHPDADRRTSAPA